MPEQPMWKLPSSEEYRVPDELNVVARHRAMETFLLTLDRELSPRESRDPATVGLAMVRAFDAALVIYEMFTIAATVEEGKR